MSTLALVGDVGGTKTLLRLVDEQGVALRTARFDSRGAELAAIITRFLDGVRPRVAVLGVAGPVLDGVCATTNLPWLLDERALERQLGISRVRLLNDFEATAYGVLHVDPSQLISLQGGERRPHGQVAVIGAGTGLGEAFLVWTGDDYVVVPTEGGHGDFAPRNDREDLVLRTLRARLGRVSVERVVSGLGIVEVYEALRDGGVAPESEAVAAQLRAGDPGAVIGEHALRGGDPLCEATIDLFVSAYGAEAGNFALRTLARGGVFVTGGIAPKLLPKLREGAFVQAFRDKGRLSDVVDAIPVSVVLDPEVPLVGALHVARAIAARVTSAGTG
ncbi:MAG: glucokinase [Deltaproteobacteria bacterium]|nr:glucokinase [Deltaproteobacteria bacterium]